MNVNFADALKNFPQNHNHIKSLPGHKFASLTENIQPMFWKLESRVWLQNHAQYENLAGVFYATARMDQLFYFIRSKIDIDITNEQTKKGFNKEETLLKIRRNCEENLKDVGNPKVFILNCKNHTAFDFKELVDTLNSELPQHKQDALL